MTSRLDEGIQYMYEASTRRPSRSDSSNIAYLTHSIHSLGRADRLLLTCLTTGTSLIGLNVELTDNFRLDPSRYDPFPWPLPPDALRRRSGQQSGQHSSIGTGRTVLPLLEGSFATGGWR